MIDRLDELPDDRREALIMRFALGMSNREIARALGRTDGATKVLIHRAIKQLEEEMSETSERGTPMTRPTPATSRRCWPTRCGRSSRPRTSPRRVEATLSAITEQAAAELSSWADELSEGELEALRDPRNWVRPVAAVAVGGVAGGALVVVGMRRRRRPSGLRGDRRARLQRPRRAELGALGARPARAARAGRGAASCRASPRRRARPVRPRIRCRTLSSVLTGIEPEDRVAAADR